MPVLKKYISHVRSFCIWLWNSLWLSLEQNNFCFEFVNYRALLNNLIYTKICFCTNGVSMLLKSRASVFWDLKPKKDAAFPWALPTTLHQTHHCLLPTKGESRKNPADSALELPSSLPLAGLLFLCLPVGGAAVPFISSRDLPSLQIFILQGS